MIGGEEVGAAGVAEAEGSRCLLCLLLLLVILRLQGCCGGSGRVGCKGVWHAGVKREVYRAAG